MNWVGIITVVAKLIVFFIALYYFYALLNPTLSTVDGDPSEPRDIPIAIARRDYLCRYIELASHDQATASLMKRYMKELYNYTFSLGFFDDGDGLSDVLNDSDRNDQLMKRLESPEYQHALRSSKSQSRLHRQLTLIYHPTLDRTMLNRYLVNHPSIVYQQPNLFKVDYT